MASNTQHAHQPTRIRRRFIRRNGDLRVVDTPISFEQLQALTKRKLDRRKAYAIISGEIAELCRFTRRCSGCTSGGEPEFCRDEEIGAGCPACGYHGKIRIVTWVPTGLRARRQRHAA